MFTFRTGSASQYKRSPCPDTRALPYHHNTFVISTAAGHKNLHPMARSKRFPYLVEAPLPITSNVKRKVAAAHIPDTAAEPERPKTREVTLYEQGCFIIYCRVNLIAGPTDPKDWETVAHKFNAYFKMN
jgi:hypothetical protein